MQFLTEVMNETLEIKDKDEDELYKDLDKRGYYKLKDKGLDETYSTLSSYSYLLNMNIRSFTKQKLESLKEDIDKIEYDLDKVKRTTPKDMWLNELNDLETEYNKLYK